MKLFSEYIFGLFPLDVVTIAELGCNKSGYGAGGASGGGAGGAEKNRRNGIIFHSG